MSNVTDDEFQNMTPQERVDIIENRMGGSHTGRIVSLVELFDMIGETMYFVISPFGPNGNKNLGNAYIYEWKVGAITKQDKVPIIDRDELLNPVSDDAFYCLYNSSDFKALNIMDLNIIPNIDNNHAAFNTKEAAEAYVVYRKLKWDVDSDIDTIAKEFEPWLTEDQLDRKDNKE